MLTTTGIARGIGSHRKAANRQPPTRLSPNANTSSHPRFRFSEPWAHELGRTSQHVNVNFNELLLLTYPRLVPSTPDVDEHSEEEGSVQVSEMRTWGDAPSRSCACCSMACSRNLSSLFCVAIPAESRC